MSRVIIDGDSYIYKAACSCSKLINIDRDIYYEGYDLNNARVYMRLMVSNVCNKCGANDYVIVLAHRTTKNFRYYINPNYKSNRKAMKKPIMLDLVMDMVEKEFDTISIPYLEADDVVRIMYENGEGNSVVSIDKDLKTFPCKIYDTYHNTFTYVLPQQAEANFKRQLLIGDTCDGYSGIKGIGKATADKLLMNGITVDEIAQKYIESGLTLDDFKRTYNCAKILGKDDYNNGIIKLYGGEELNVRDIKS